ncbi:acyl-CoA N-acyltransferase [Elsinoe ampelina]|uniref:Acyl-CoA N-acyltransferase n=1 Tax=Elsinoe ampelina TaxID=302913 RepID=A0A6A6GCY2_9PEZI|nr:acyl-CoA N-acyltransferase [Elsinoe ampelina]
MTSNLNLRPARRSDISRLAHLGNAANAQSALHRRISPGRDTHPGSYYLWRLNIIRERFATPNLRSMVVEDTSTSEILGLSCWTVEGSDTPLYKRWVSESSWTDWVERKLIGVEKLYGRYVSDGATDYAFLDGFMAAFLGQDQMAHPPCVRLHMIVVDPKKQSKGVGRMMIDWGKELALKEDLPVYLESNLEATGFYEKGGFSRLGEDMVVDPDGDEPFRIPVFVWEGEERMGRWLEPDTSGARWRWKAGVPGSSA